MATTHIHDLPSGARISYVVAGQGPPLVQIHGVGTGHRNFASLSPLLGHRLQTIDLDLPGYGESQADPHPSSVHDFALVVAEFLREVGLAPANVHGTSMGGRIALALASEHPEVVKILVASLAVARMDKAALVMRQTWQTAAQQGGPEALAHLTAVQGFSRRFWDRPDRDEIMNRYRTAAATSTAAGFVKDMRSTTAAVDLEDALGSIRAPTLLIAADEDSMNPLRVAPSGFGIADMAEAIADAELAVVPGGHFLIFEDPALIADAVLDFLERRS
jgi:pimeloyl-ACP methyl ester carboxylesterase